MNSKVDPQLMRLREVEAKIVLLAVHLEEAEETVQMLDREHLLSSVHEQHRQAILVALEVLRRHREVILKLMQPVTAPSASTDA